MQQDIHATKWTYSGLFLITLATLMFEILLTRIFSVTMWYHFAFMAISIAMFGMTLGALRVYIDPRLKEPGAAKRHMAWSSTIFGFSVGFAFLCLVWFPSSPNLGGGGLGSVALTYVVVSVPFVYSGTCVCLALTKFPGPISRLYAADLAGAAAGCVAVILVLEVTDALTAVVAVGFLASLAAVLFAVDDGYAKLSRVGLAFALVAAGFIGINTHFVEQQRPLVRIRWIKGGPTVVPLYEKWNSFSRIAVSPGWAISQNSLVGLSDAYENDDPIHVLSLTIDGSAETSLIPYHGDFRRLDFLKYDVKQFANYLGTGRSVLVVGSGGGADVLAALEFGQQPVRAVEINEDILRTVNQRFGEFTGHLDRDSKVTFANDEARSYIARLRERFDTIQISFIDTWAATAAGAFSLSENSLYTLEAWKVFFDHLTPGGVLSVSRWYVPGQPAETYRLTSLAAEALKENGVRDPRRHLFLIANINPIWKTQVGAGAATLLVSPAGFSDQDFERLNGAAEKLSFSVLLSPTAGTDAGLVALASGGGVEGLMSNYPLDLSPPTDDRPFFFQMTRLRDAFRPLRGVRPVGSWNLKASGVLVTLLLVVVGLTVLCIIVPLGFSSGRAPLRGAAPYALYFGAIGLGYMLVEVSQLQHLIIFLGHPTYALSVVLFTLLLSSGLGSYSTRQDGRVPGSPRAYGRLLSLLVLLLGVGILSRWALPLFQQASIVPRITVVVALLFPLGFFMGMPFPLGMQVASQRSDASTPWLWGINGATSICASVLAIVIAMGAGISAAYWTGAACYAAALATFLWLGHQVRPKENAAALGLDERQLGVYSPSGRTP